MELVASPEHPAQPFMAVTSLLCLALLMLGAACEPVEELEEATGSAASLVSVEPQGQTLALGDSTTLAVQALDSAGVPVNGARVYFLVTETESLVFEEEEAGDFFVTTTREGDAAGVRVAGLAIATVTVRESAPEGTAKVVAGLIAPSTDPPGDAVKVLRLTIEPEQPQGGAGQGG